MINLTCTRCKEEKPANLFPICSNKPRGYAYHCKNCDKERYKKYAAMGLPDSVCPYYVCTTCKEVKTEDNFGRRIGSISGKKSQCKACASKCSLRSRAKKLEHYQARSRKYVNENPDKARAATAKYTAAKLQRVIPATEEVKINRVMHAAHRISKLTGIPHHVDHIVPLQSKYVCGLHSIFNVRIITKQENLSKQNRYWPNMW